jgi:membrane-associated phospholipid phosphatase
MKKIGRKTIIHCIVAIIAFILIITNVYFVKSEDVFGSPLLFAFGLLNEIILIVVFAYSLVRALKTPLNILGTILVSAWEGILTNPYVKRISKNETPLYRWLNARFDHKNPFGWVLTFGVAISFLFFNSFSGILRNLWFHDPLTRIDTRVVNLMPSIRTPLQTSFFRFITFTSNTETILLLVLLSGVILWRNRQRVMAGLFVLVFIGEEGIAYLLKHSVDRIRTAPSFSHYPADSFSFISGHVLRATILFGLLSYLLFRSFKSSIVRLGIVVGYILSVALIALSRVYLGVHYPSGVLASFQIGASLLTLIITGIEITIRFEIWGQNLKSYTNKLLGIVPIVIILISILAGPALIHLSPVAAEPRLTILDSLNKITVKKLPLFSETLSGKTMEPINFIYLGSAQQIEQAFLSHGWFKADPSTLSNLLKALSVGLQGHQYLNAPVTPSYLAAKPENLAFQQPTKSNTLRQRHHTRLWRTDFRLADGKEIWVATASFDEGIEFAGPAKLPTHHIDPNIDAERTYIATSLNLKVLSELQVVKPQAGKNAAGDIFFTDGRALLTSLSNK